MKPARVLLAMVALACGPSSWPGGIHAVLRQSPDGIWVQRVPHEGPAGAAGLQVGDLLVAVNGTAVAGLSSAEIRQLLTGEVGSMVTLQVERSGTLHEFTIERAPYTKPGS